MNETYQTPKRLIIWNEIIYKIKQVVNKYYAKATEFL